MPNPFSQSLVHLLWGHLGQIQVPHYGTSSDTQISALPVPCVPSLAMLNVMTSWKPLDRCQCVPAQQSTRESRLATDNMMHPMVTAPLRHPVRVDMSTALGKNIGQNIAGVA